MKSLGEGTSWWGRRHPGKCHVEEWKAPALWPHPPHPHPQLPTSGQPLSSCPHATPMAILIGRPASFPILPESHFLNALGQLQIVPLPLTLPCLEERRAAVATSLPRWELGTASQAGPSQGRGEMWEGNATPGAGGPGVKSNTFRLTSFIPGTLGGSHLALDADHRCCWPSGVPHQVLGEAGHWVSWCKGPPIVHPGIPHSHFADEENEAQKGE